MSDQVRCPAKVITMTRARSLAVSEEDISLTPDDFSDFADIEFSMISVMGTDGLKSFGEIARALVAKLSAARERFGERAGTPNHQSAPAEVASLGPDGRLAEKVREDVFGGTPSRRCDRGGCGRNAQERSVLEFRRAVVGGDGTWMERRHARNGAPSRLSIAPVPPGSHALHQLLKSSDARRNFGPQSGSSMRFFATAMP